MPADPPHTPTRHSALSTRHYPRLILSALLASALLQIPLAWTWVLLFRARSYSEDSILIPAPPSAASGIAVLKVDNRSYPGARWIRISGWSAGAVPSLMVYRSHPGEPYDSNPTYPLSARDAFPALADPAQWPTQSLPSSNVQYGVTFCELEAIGWPFLCARGRVDHNPAQTATTTRGLAYTRSPFLDNFPRTGAVALCYHPIPLGYILNTLFYTTIVLAALIPLSILRRNRRIRNGRCPNCNYDLHATPDDLPCPECGAACHGMSRL
jgi:hypothetical protein